VNLITLENRQLRLVVNAAEGVNVLAFATLQNGVWLPVMPDVREATVDLSASSFVMVPYSNRIADGRFTFAGQSYQLAHGERHAIHGDVRGRAWQVNEHTAERIVCSFDSRQHGGVNWPWPFTSSQTYALVGAELQARLTLTNVGDSPLPAGFGWHPYYSRWLTREGEAVQLHFQVDGVYPDANNNRIPSGPGQAPAPNQDFRTEQALAPDNFIDICCYGYDGNGTITWPESNLRLIYRCSPECSHLVLYNPAKPYFAVEPVTNANNGVNLLAAGDPTSGVQVLQPGETLTATFDIVVEHLITNQPTH
jgi:aldose 1-epimerase